MYGWLELVLKRISRGIWACFYISFTMFGSRDIIFRLRYVQGDPSGQRLYFVDSDLGVHHVMPIQTDLYRADGVDAPPLSLQKMSKKIISFLDPPKNE